VITNAHETNAATKLRDSFAIDIEYSEGMKKNVTTRNDITVAIDPATSPPNQALPMIAPKKRNTKGYAITCCSGKVQRRATSTKMPAMTLGLRPYCQA
jgi:hypothetical protein